MYYFLVSVLIFVIVYIVNFCVAFYGQWEVFYDLVLCYRFNNLKEVEIDLVYIRLDQIIFLIRFFYFGFIMIRWFQFIVTSVRLEIEYMLEYYYEIGQYYLKVYCVCFYYNVK